MAAPGMKDLTAKQTDEIEAIFGHRFVTVQQNPDILSRRQRRALGHRTRYFGGGTMKVPRG